MTSCLIRATVRHARATPARHAFAYPLYRCVLDLDELPALGRDVPGFGYNRFAPLSIYDRDYLDRGAGTLREKVERLLRANGFAAPPSRVLLVTDAALFRCVFNPVSFYFTFDAAGAPQALLLEVNNVVGDRHLYVLPADGGGAADGARGWAAGRLEKAFHVSPFNAVEGHYRVRVSDVRERLEAHVDLHGEAGAVMTASLAEEERLPFTREGLRRLLRQPPLAAWRTLPRILREAARLFFGKRLAFHARPVVTSPNALRVRAPTRFQRLCRRAVEAGLARLRDGALAYATPAGARVLGDAAGGVRAALTVRDWAFFTRVATGGDIGFGEAYMEGLWDTPDLNALIRLLIDNREHLEDRRLAPTLANAALTRLGHLLRDNTLRGSRRNIQAHYDLSNAFFQTFLDPSLMYSCGLYRDPSETLEQAQANKLDAVIAKARLRPEDHVLEIGCGWGGFALRAARAVGCRVTGLTLSREQFALARERVRDAGLEGRVEILLQDYRTLAGRFDKIVSIEMLEAVGHRHLGTFFRRCDELLAPHGLAVIQVITIPDQRYELYRRDCDWMRRHIFPGGHLPSLTAMCEAMTRASALIVESVENLGPHYARTLSDWKRRFLADPGNRAAFERRSVFHRKWLYYLCYCQAAFESRTLEDLQLVLTRPANRRLPQAPYGEEGA